MFEPTRTECSDQEVRTAQKALVVCPNPELRKYVQKGISKGGFDSLTVMNLASAREVLETETFPVVLVELDDPLPPEQAASLSQFVSEFPSIVILGIAPRPSAEFVRDATLCGVKEFLTNPFDYEKVALLAQDSINQYPVAPLGKEVLKAEATKKAAPNKARSQLGAKKPGCIITKNALMSRVLDIVGRVAPTDSTILIEGESGTGKELIAKRIHELSERSKQSFVEVHCGAIPPNLLESQLFGHERGSFTGAVHRQMGLFEIANGGSIFLDEIAEMNLDMQVKLLRVLQERTFRRIGGKNNLQVDVRVIAAANRDLEVEVEAKRFRADLYYRLNVISLKVPPVRERLEDIPELVKFFTARLHKEKNLPKKKFHPDTIKRMQQLRWIGNVREIENVVERLVLLTSNDEILPEELGEHIADRSPSNDSPYEVSMTLDEVKKIHIANVLGTNEGNKMKTARMLGINVKTLYNLIQRLNIEF